MAIKMKKEQKQIIGHSIRVNKFTSKFNQLIDEISNYTVGVAEDEKIIFGNLITNLKDEFCKFLRNFKV